MGQFGRSACGILCVTGAVLLAGCAAESAGGGDPGYRPLPQGQSCQTIRAELNRMDSRGVPSKIEASQSGRKLSPGDKADVDRYNNLLGQYLGGRCHV
ncbi:MAG: hypothetical protein KDJ90_04810 [Nitratireductor sp.]|nr:hypothetical protein [Nitratireductor sp.]